MNEDGGEPGLSAAALVNTRSRMGDFVVIVVVLCMYVCIRVVRVDDISDTAPQFFGDDIHKV